ncbi:hypothetical protein LX36DRAFT_659234 [Colletotrichum falcatum]|nr:hypothetical protein LX36DRAFT_659234 [Colletotrichum falcatum]
MTKEAEGSSLNKKNPTPPSEAALPFPSVFLVLIAAHTVSAQGGGHFHGDPTLHTKYLYIVSHVYAVGRYVIRALCCGNADELVASDATVVEARCYRVVTAWTPTQPDLARPGGLLAILLSLSHHPIQPVWFVRFVFNCIVQEMAREHRPRDSSLCLDLSLADG